MFNDTSSLPAYFATRRSGKPRDMIAPGPDKDSLFNILELASRTPDHGKLFPWRFVVIEDRAALAGVLARAFVAANPDARTGQVEAAVEFIHNAPTLVVLLYAHQESAKIPDWEQELSAGAAGMNLLHSVHAHGFVGSWITGWAAFDENVRKELAEGEERLAGFFFIGTPGKELEERPRPDASQVVRYWP